MKKTVKTLIGAILAINLLSSTTASAIYSQSLSQKDNPISANILDDRFAADDYKYPFICYCNVYHYSPTIGIIQSEEGKSFYSYDVLDKEPEDIDLSVTKETDLRNLINNDKKYNNGNLEKAYKAFYIKTQQQQKSGILTLDAEDTLKIVSGEEDCNKFKHIEKFGYDNKKFNEYCNTIKLDISLWKSLREKLTLQDKDIKGVPNYYKTIYTTLNDAYYLADKFDWWYNSGAEGSRAIFNYINPNFNEKKDINSNYIDKINKSYELTRIYDSINVKDINYEYSTKHKEDLIKNKYQDKHLNLQPNDYVVDLDFFIKYSSDKDTSTKSLYKKNVRNFLKLVSVQYDKIKQYIGNSKTKTVYIKSSEFDVCKNDEEFNQYDTFKKLGDALKNDEGGISSDLDGYLAVGDSRGGIEAKITLDGNGKLNVVLDYYLDDYYNYNIYNNFYFGDTSVDTGTFLGEIDVPEKISQQDMAILHMAGFAKEYRMIGKTTANFTVSKNELESNIVNDINKLDFK